MIYSKDVMKPYCFYFHSFVYPSLKEMEAILYNTLSGEFIYEDNPEIVHWLQDFRCSGNNVKVFSFSDISENVKIFLHKTKDLFIGDWFEYAACAPFQFSTNPVLGWGYKNSSVTSDEYRLLENDHESDYLSTLTLKINGSCKRDCFFCETASKQFLCCNKKDSEFFLSLEMLKELLESLENSFFLQELNIVGGNIFEHNKVSEIVTLLNLTDYKVNYYTEVNNLIDSAPIYLLKGFSDNSSIVVVFDCSLNRDDLFACNQMLLKNFSGKVDYKCIVQSEEDIGSASSLYNVLKGGNFQVLPFAYNNNSDFLMDNVYLGKDFLDGNVIDMLDIKRNILLNSNSIKRAYISNDGTFYTGLNCEGVGNIKKDNLKDLVVKSFGMETSSWRKSRKDFGGCKKCAMDVFCPPLSEMEMFFGKPMCWKSVQ